MVPTAQAQREAAQQRLVGQERKARLKKCEEGIKYHAKEYWHGRDAIEGFLYEVFTGHLYLDGGYKSLKEWLQGEDIPLAYGTARNYLCHRRAQLSQNVSSDTKSDTAKSKSPAQQLKGFIRRLEKQIAGKPNEAAEEMLVCLRRALGFCEAWEHQRGL